MERVIKGYSDQYYFQAFPLIKVLNAILALVSFIAIGSLLLQYGFYLPTSLNSILHRVDLFIVQFYLLQFIIKFIVSKDKFDFLKHRWFEAILAFFILTELLFLFKNVGLSVLSDFFSGIDVTAITEIYIGVAQVLIIASIMAEGIRYNTKIASLKFNPSQTLIFSFVVMILIGAGMLMLPRAVVSGKSIFFIDALFTSASAVCVTGLTVVDTGTFFSPFGQMIIMMLIQIGGLGIMTLSSFLALFFGQGVGIRERIVLNQMMNLDKMGMISSMLRNIVLITLSIEAIGALFFMLLWSDNHWSLNRLVFNSVFHSISAFCNAGFSTFSDSLIQFQRNIPVLSVFAALIVLGGLGFTVFTDFIALFSRKKSDRKKVRLLKIQTKIVLIITGILLSGGFLLLYLLDTSNSGLTRLSTAAFNSVTARTAGFNSIDFKLLNTPSILIIIMLMFIGASPGSTGGGIKTTTIGVLWASIIAIITGQNRIIIFKRRLPFLILNRALVIFAFSVIVVAVAITLLSITEQAPILDIIFEAISAYGTAGLSLGLTGSLSMSGKIIIILLMFIGRLGTLTLVFAITSPTEQPPVRIEYPSESVMIG
ncbi:MAG TPA: potassium transporter TrkG [Chitinispirillaceae bacterium]|nr:potassium transporter TrkG [Chitinispirillaceae bacterium]